MKVNMMVKNRGGKKLMYMRFQYFLKMENGSRLRKPQRRRRGCVRAAGENCTVLLRAAH